MGEGVGVRVVGVHLDLELGGRESIFSEAGGGGDSDMVPEAYQMGKEKLVGMGSRFVDRDPMVLQNMVPHLKHEREQDGRSSSNSFESNVMMLSFVLG